MATNKKVIFTDHAKQRAYQRLNISHDRFSLLFETALSDIFKKSVRGYPTDDGTKIKYEAIEKGKKVTFICDEKGNEIIVNTIIVN